MFIPLHVQVALFVKNENSVRAVPLLRDLFCTQRRKKSLHFVWGLRNPLWIVSLASALSTLNSPNSLKQPTHSWIMLEQGIQRGKISLMKQDLNILHPFWRHNLPPSLEIITPNYKWFSNIPQKVQNFRNIPKISPKVYKNSGYII